VTPNNLFIVYSVCEQRTRFIRWACDFLSLLSSQLEQRTIINIPRRKPQFLGSGPIFYPWKER